jgi:site-specific recombinase XerD
MAYDTKRRWSRVFVRTTASEPRHARRLRPAAPAGPSVNETIEEFLEAVDDGWARDRYGRSFTHEAAHDLHWYLRGHFGEALGAIGLEDVRRRDLETLVDALAESGMSRHRQRVLATSVRALYDYAIERRLVRGNPAERVGIPDDHHPSDPSVLHHGIELVLRVATLGFALSALILLTESL